MECFLFRWWQDKGILKRSTRMQCTLPTLKHCRKLNMWHTPWSQHTCSNILADTYVRINTHIVYKSQLKRWCLTSMSRTPSLKGWVRSRFSGSSQSGERLNENWDRILCGGEKNERLLIVQRWRRGKTNEVWILTSVRILSEPIQDCWWMTTDDTICPPHSSMSTALRTINARLVHWKQKGYVINMFPRGSYGKCALKNPGLHTLSENIGILYKLIILLI